MDIASGRGREGDTKTRREGAVAIEPSFGPDLVLFCFFDKVKKRKDEGVRA